SDPVESILIFEAVIDKLGNKSFFAAITPQLVGMSAEILYSRYILIFVEIGKFLGAAVPVVFPGFEKWRVAHDSVELIFLVYHSFQNIVSVVLEAQLYFLF